MSVGGGGRGSAPGRGRGRGAGCNLFKLDDQPVRKLQVLGDPVAGQIAAAKAEDDVEIDPLDAFMAQNTKEAAKPKSEEVAGSLREGWEELEGDDAVVSYYEAFEQGKGPDASPSDESDPEFDEDGNVIEGKKKAVAPLAPVDHSKIEYADIQMDFYKPHSDISQLTPEQVIELRTELSVSATGPQCPCPVASFAHLGLPPSLMEGIRKHGYAKPTPIQAQTIPAGLSGRDVVGIAETGSGKTVSYLLPMLVHCAAQPELQKDDGPIGIVLCPTRELAIQVEKETFKFNKLLGLRSTTLAGGLSKKEQFKDIKRGSEIIIANPGRMIDIIKMKGMNLKRCTFVVLDEADRMLHMGFEYQVRSIVQNMRPNRQTLLFSATLPPKIERLASDLLRNPVRVVVGQIGNVAECVKQAVEVLENADAKWSWLNQRIDGMLAKGQVLIFVKSKQGTEDLLANFKDLLQNSNALALHGDLEQSERMRILDTFRAGKATVLVATDVASRGLDVPTIRTVVSYDAPRDIDTHTHRVGRTGRAGIEGEAFTLLTDEKHDEKIASVLFASLQATKNPVNASLAALAQKHTPFRASKMKEQKRQVDSGLISQNAAAATETGQPARQRSRSRSPKLS